MNVQRPLKKKKNPIKSVFGWLHLWVGLLSGLVVFISMSGAAIFVWEEELTSWYYSDIVNNEQVAGKVLPVSMLYKSVSEAYPDKDFNFMRASKAGGKNYSWRSYKKAERPSWTWASGIEHYIDVYVNPYTGQVTGQIDKRKDWITLSRFLHQNLLLKHDVGSQIVGAAALIMIFLALSGLYLWWPKNRKAIKQRLKIKWDASFKRVNWDIHSVGGFYTYLLLIFFAGTGLVWSYQWWGNGIYRLLGNDPKEVFVRPEKPTLSSNVPMLGMDKAFQDALERRPNWYKIYFSIPSRQAEKGVIGARLYYNSPDSWWETHDLFYYHPESGELYHTFTHDEKLLGEKWRNSNYAMHVGSIYGLPTKIIAFVSALFFAILPISGFLIWWGRKMKKGKPQKAVRAKTANGMRPKVQVFQHASK